MRMLFQSALGACFVRQNGTMSAAKTHSFRRRKKAKWPIGAEPHSNANRSERPRACPFRNWLSRYNFTSGNGLACSIIFSRDAKPIL
jgi:hypothetical protein